MHINDIPPPAGSYLTTSINKKRIPRLPNNNNTMRQFYYRKTDRRAILLLLSLIVAAFSLIHFFGGKLGAQTAGTLTTDSTEIGKGFITDGSQRTRRYGTSDKTTGKISEQTYGANNSTTNEVDNATEKTYYASEGTFYDTGQHRAELFYFDPNTADSTQLLRLGLQPWQVRNIYRYRNKGGIYSRPEDFARLYGLTAGQYRRMKPYIRISPDFLPAALLPEASYGRNDTTARQKKLGDGEQIVLNTADSTQLLQVPGIGRYFTRRILSYGKQLGGYVSVDQLDEIEDFPTESKKYFTISAPATHRFNLNRLSIAELRRHPYITFHQAQAIADYRRVHGSIRNLNELKTHRDFPPEAIERLLPYVEY